MNNLDTAYEIAQKMAKDHYENFPVISRFLPEDLRKHVAVVYLFARKADDIADEGNVPPFQRIKSLDEYEDNFRAALAGKYRDEVWMALHNTIFYKKLDPQLFLMLLEAFRQDTKKNRYKTFKELVDYCKLSANPVGRIILQLHQIDDEKIYFYSDNICTALQITNFLQDISADLEKNRIYIPREDLYKFNMDENSFASLRNVDAFNALIKYETDRVRYLFDNGRKILPMLPSKLRTQILWTIMGGEKIINKIDSLQYKVLNSSPKLNKSEHLLLMMKALITAKKYAD
ncbi:MAG: squalene synthase HpnC [Melioribacteraceae bacterium]|nr:MAG: squalene synthase HpnC [Melioribacteraceae bacterium]